MIANSDLFQAKLTLLLKGDHLVIDILDRSFPSHKMFIQGTSEGKEGRAALFRVLAVYAMYNPEVSYCQGNLRPPYIKHFIQVFCEDQF